MIEVSSSGEGDFVDDFMRQVSDDVHEELAQGLADTARENGVTDVNEIEVALKNDSPDDVPLDEARIRARAAEILAGG